MKILEEIQKKVSALGGVRKNPLCSDEPNYTVDETFLLKVERTLGTSLPSEYTDTIRAYGAFSFKNRVKFKCEVVSPVADNNNRITVDYFYNLANQGECAVEKLLTVYAGQLPDYLLPICDGEAGDLICIDLRK